MGRLAGRTALVTGGASGLGRAIAARLADEGASVVISDVQRELGEQVAAGLGAQFLYQDVTSEEQWPLVLARAALLATPDSTAYGAAKAAVRQLTKSVAQHCAQERLGIRCNSVHPGEVRTPLWDGYIAQTAQVHGVPAGQLGREAKARVPLGGMPEPEDIAAGVAFLCSDDARFITGAGLVIDGGLVYCDTFSPPAR